MTCYGKTTKKGKHIAKNHTNVVQGEKYEFIDGRIRKCQKCSDNFWIRKNLFCLLRLRRAGRTLWPDPNAFVPALAAKEENKCLKGVW